MQDDELSEQDIAPLIQALEQRDAVYRRRDEQPYGGVLGRLPQWVPEWHQKQFEETRNRLLDTGVHGESLSPDIVQGYIKIYTELGVTRGSTIAKPGEQTDGPEWIPPEVMNDVGYLAHLLWAVSLGENRGLKELSGLTAARGAAHAKAYSKGGRASKKKAGIWAAVKYLVKENPNITAKQAWSRFPVGSHSIRTTYGFELYRDGNKLVQLDDRTGHDVAITFSTFQRYISQAKSQ
jgi:hypothetical protein